MIKSTVELKEQLEAIIKQVNRIDEEVNIYNLSDNGYTAMINSLITIELKLNRIN